MQIKSITIAADGGAGEVEIMRIEGGALITQGDRVICEVRRDEDPEQRRLKAIEVAKAVYGIARASRYGGGGGPNCTGSMIYDVRNEIERIADC